MTINELQAKLYILYQQGRGLDEVLIPNDSFEDDGDGFIDRMKGWSTINKIEEGEYCIYLKTGDE